MDKEWPWNKNPEYSQHNTFISPNDSCLYIFGGYGNYQYKNLILKKGRTQDDWIPVSYIEEIPPRYLSGSDYKNRDTILVFGGCGNPQGKQELGVINYYDLYAIDINTFKTKKLWTIPNDTKTSSSVIILLQTKRITSYMLYIFRMIVRTAISC